jgi:hypothetical protein
MKVNESNNKKVCTNRDTCDSNAHYMISARSVLCGLIVGLKQLTFILWTSIQTSVSYVNSTSEWDWSEGRIIIVIDSRKRWIYVVTEYTAS